ncbi:MAG: type II secretion system protein [Candidatus Pacebacteria bacterium]|nr:type II secretion system protein [Candidatus Paceibacterota bacterium]
MEFSNKQRNRGFTLVELLIVIGLLAILTTVTILVLNPVQLFAQARDATRLSDLDTINSALAYYLSTASSTTVDLDAAVANGCTTYCFTHVAEATAGSNCGSRHAALGKETELNSSDRDVDGTGWIPVDIRNSTGGPPISNYPVDPSSTSSYFYDYTCDNSNFTYELDANMESVRYAYQGSDDVESTDGGNSATIYEVGTDPGLDL